MLYTGGFVDFRLVEQARSFDGRFYHSLNPDVFSAIVFAKLTDRYVYSNEPLAVGGSSTHSGGTSFFSKGKSVRFTETPGGKFFSEPNIPFHETLVESDGGMLPPSIELLAYESLLQAEYIEPSCRSLTEHAEQLAIILGRAKRRHRSEITSWARQFADRHALDMATISRRAKLIRAREKLLKALGSVGRARKRLDIQGTASLPIHDVYDAAIVTSTIISQRAAR
jgi:hypothetical protein